MITPIRINLRYWFYPIRNTPAVNLFRDTKRGEGPVKILYLACGDPRNILFTLWSEHISSDSPYGVSV